MSRSALVTGAAAGIGRAAALALAARRVEVICCDRDAAGAQATAARCGGRAAVCDLSRDGEVEALCANAGPLAALVHSAGLFPRVAFADAALPDLDRVMAVNFRAAAVLAHAVWRGMAETGGGAMVFLTSGAGLLSAVEDPMQRGFSLYGASKAALDRWALGVAHELSPHGVRVNTITPGAFVHTPGLEALGLSEAQDGPSITPEAVADAVAWLALDAPFAGRRLSAADFGKSWGPGAP